MFERIKFAVISVCLFIGLIFAFPVKDIYSFIKFEIYKKENLFLTVKKDNPQIIKLSSEPSNRLVLKAAVRNKSGLPVNKALVHFHTDKNLGKIQPDTVRTDSNGEATAYYMPPSPEILTGYCKQKDGLNNSNTLDVKIYANIGSSKEYEETSVTLIQPPVVYIHGFQASGNSFGSLKDYITKLGILGNTFEYESQDGVINASRQLDSFLEKLQLEYNRNGVQVNRFSLVTHSMGGLVARYYTCSQAYIKRDNVCKLIFIAVPHRGSPWASLGKSQFNSKGLEDLMPESTLFTNAPPAMINKGLNNTIETGSIAGQYDEVVSQASSSLKEWQIQTSLFYIGESNYDVNKLFEGSFYRSLNHVNILNNSLVFKKIEELLLSKLAYPVKK